MKSRAPELSTTEASGARASVKRIASAFFPLVLLGGLLLTGLPLCPLRNMVGVPCPGCGLTRATFALFQGDLREALRLHPLVLLVTPTIAFLVLRSTLVSARWLRSDQWQIRLPRWAPIVFGVLLIGVWIARFAGFLGGPSDPVDPAHSLVGRAVHLISTTLF